MRKAFSLWKRSHIASRCLCSVRDIVDALLPIRNRLIGSRSDEVEIDEFWGCCFSCNGLFGMFVSWSEACLFSVIDMEA